MVDYQKCSGCGECVRQCPKSALVLEQVLVDLEDKTVAVVKEEHRKQLKFTCSVCEKMENGGFCVTACPKAAIKHIWVKQ